MYHYDPSNLPATIRYSNTRKKSDRQKTLNNNGKPNSKESTTNNNFTKTKINGDAEKSAVILIDNKYSKTNQSTNNNSEEIEDDSNEEEEEEEDEIEEYDQIPSIKTNAESLVEDESCKTKDENCENEC